VIELFSTRDPARAALLASKLERLNRERREAEAAALAAIEIRLATSAEMAADSLLVVDARDGIARSSASRTSRVVERTAKTGDCGHRRGWTRGKNRPRLRPFGRWVSTTHSIGKLRGSVYTLRRPRLRRGPLRCLPPRCPNSSAACVFMPASIWRPAAEHLLRIHANCRWIASRRCWLAGCASSNHSAMGTRAGLRGRKARLLAAPRKMKERHIRLELAQEPGRSRFYRSHPRCRLDLAAAPVRWG